MKNVRFARGLKGFALVAAGIFIVVAAASAQLIEKGGGTPAVTVTGLAKASCGGAECNGVQVTWSLTKPVTCSISGFKVEVTPPSPCTGCFSPITAANAAASATSAVVGISSGAIPAGAYTGKVTATYTCPSTVSGSKSQTF